MADHELRMYILLNTSVKMKPGKAIAQAGHGISEMTEYLVKRNDPVWREYRQNSYPKIALKCPEDLLLNLHSKYKDRSQSVWCLNVEDEGRTQVPKGTVTAVVFKPMRKVDVPEELETLRLY
uniref:peptidyl-tRNA hydrolase n=1 Tax=Marseillevirus LCMAC101 TaxID=2506602 RepID=A0A481YS20_9VIRU|nr:MAG: peptidyl-tRNA hydrolase [Marseillevirus LCMAC101]